MKYSKSEKRFQLFNLSAIVALFILILAGGVVRGTGSGMGCPDWPKCFGKYIPPVSEEQLPKNYRTDYAQHQLKKNSRLVKVLHALGYNSLASKIKASISTSDYVQEEFNAAKTWTEYTNRLIGAITGFLLLITALYSFYYWKSSKLIALLSVLNLILVAFQAWIGSIVVSTNLVSWVVTVHMLIALVILAISIYTFHKAKLMDTGKTVRSKFFIQVLTVLALTIDVVQIVVGTEVREKIDEYAARMQGNFRQDWITGANEILYNHKNVALGVIVINIILYVFIRRNFIKSSIQQQLMSATVIIIMLQIFAGVILSYWALPPSAQVVHILLASVLFGAQFYLLLNLFRSAETSGVKYGME